MTDQNKSTSILDREITLFSQFGDKKKEVFYNDISILLNAGVDLKTGLEILIEGAKGKVEKKIYSDLHQDLVAGVSISKAFEKTNMFSQYEYHSIGIGEETGSLNVVLEELRKYFKQRNQLKKQVTSVFVYPVFVLLVTFGVLFFMMNNVVPMFEDVFRQFGGELPDLTKNIIAISEIFPYIALGFLAFILLIGFSIYLLRENTEARRITSNIILKIPFVGNLVNKIYLTRFCQAMSLLTMARTPLVESIDLTSKMISFYPYEYALGIMKEDINAGVDLNISMAKFSIFNSQIISLVRISEETNQLDLIFSRLKEQFSEELEHQTKMIGRIIEPAMILVVGALVGVIMIAMYMPMFNLSNVVGQ